MRHNGINCNGIITYRYDKLSASKISSIGRSLTHGFRDRIDLPNSVSRNIRLLSQARCILWGMGYALFTKNITIPKRTRMYSKAQIILVFEVGFFFNFNFRITQSKKCLTNNSFLDYFFDSCLSLQYILFLVSVIIFLVSVFNIYCKIYVSVLQNNFFEKFSIIF